MPQIGNSEYLLQIKIGPGIAIMLEYMGSVRFLKIMFSQIEKNKKLTWNIEYQLQVV